MLQYYTQEYNAIYTRDNSLSIPAHCKYIISCISVSFYTKTW